MDFGLFLMDFGFLFGHKFGSLFDIFCHVDRQKVCLDCRYDFYRLLNGKPADFWCPNLSICVVNTDVFTRCHFFDIFVNLMILGTNLDLILDTSGGLVRPVWWYLGVLEIDWNFIDFQVQPQLRLRNWWTANWCTRGYSRTVTNPRLLTCRPANSRLITSWLVNCWFVNENLQRLMNWWLVYYPGWIIHKSTGVLIRW